MIPFPQFEQLKEGDIFNFECRKCSDCCRNVADSIMIESLDLFRLAQCFGIETTEATEKFTQAQKVAWGVPILLMKTNQPNDSCIFLKSGLCSVRTHRPRACRLYPLSMGTDDDLVSRVILKSLDRKFHFTGAKHYAGEWIDENMNAESADYIKTEYAYLHEFGKIMRLRKKPIIFRRFVRLWWGEKL
jgi:Fe-S-cluster containining protein